MQNLRSLHERHKIRQYEIIDLFRALGTAEDEENGFAGSKPSVSFASSFVVGLERSACRTGTPVRLVMFGLKYFAADSKLMKMRFAKNDDATFVSPGFASESWTTTMR